MPSVYIHTVGCQMNVLDSELVAASLAAAGYTLARSPRSADAVLFNTCSVRQHAEDKIYSALGRLRETKLARPELIVGVMGCMAQKDQERIFKRASHVDLVVGPGQLAELPRLLAEAAAARGQRIEVSLPRSTDRQSVAASFRPFDPARLASTRPNRHQAMVRIMSGCDKFCTYCIVPSVRGPEQNRPAAEIVAEVRQLVDQGCLEVTLLGQTVNSYRDESSGRRVELADLLYQLAGIGGLARLRFVTNYPRQMSDALLDAVAELPVVSPYLHIPAQSGSDRMLKRMKRGYTADEYRAMLVRVRARLPQAAVTSDFIVGFCGETEEEFRQTLALVAESRFKNSFIFKYSPRPGTVAARLYPDDVDEETKRRRNNELLAVQNAICLEDNLPWVGRPATILVEGPSKAARRRAADGPTVQLTGRTVCDRIVVFDGPPALAGRILRVPIESADAFTLFGRLPAGEAAG